MTNKAPKTFPTQYHSNGNIKRAQTIEKVDGDILATNTLWYENGIKNFEELHIYYDGTYYKVKEIIWHENGLEQSSSIFHNPYNLNYELEDTIKYFKESYYYENDQIQREINWKEIFTDRDVENIDIHYPTDYLLHHGKKTEWYEDGQIKSETLYEDGKREGKSTYWHSNGQKASYVFLKKGQLFGKHISWHVNGNQSLEGMYINDNKEGKWTEWDEKGEITLQENYKDDVLIE